MLPILVYVIGLVTMLALSAAYNMWPVLPAKWVLRRFDHSAIYLSQEPTRRSSIPHSGGAECRPGNLDIECPGNLDIERPGRPVLYVQERWT